MDIINQLAPFVAFIIWLFALLFFYFFIATASSRFLSKNLVLHKALITKFSIKEPPSPIANAIVEEYSPYEKNYLTVEYCYVFKNIKYTNNVIDKLYWFLPSSWKRTVRAIPPSLIAELNQSYLKREEINIYVHRIWPQLSTIYKHDVRTNSLLGILGFALFFLFIGQYILSLGQA